MDNEEELPLPLYSMTNIRRIAAEYRAKLGFDIGKVKVPNMGDALELLYAQNESFDFMTLPEKDICVYAKSDSCFHSDRSKDHQTVVAAFCGDMLLISESVVDAAAERDPSSDIHYRARFIVAHEIGHFLLHKYLFDDGHIGKVALTEGMQKHLTGNQGEIYPLADLEYQANFFAGSFLTPCYDYCELRNLNLLTPENISKSNKVTLGCAAVGIRYFKQRFTGGDRACPNCHFHYSF